MFVPVAYWIRRPPPKGKIAGSSPVRDVCLSECDEVMRIITNKFTALIAEWSKAPG